MRTCRVLTPTPTHAWDSSPATEVAGYGKRSPPARARLGDAGLFLKNHQPVLVIWFLEVLDKLLSVSPKYRDMKPMPNFLETH